jgi:adenylate kinase family enzyme
MDVLTPNLVCVTGPPCVGKTTVSKRLQSHMHYGYINFQDFCKLRHLHTCEEKAKGLMTFLEKIPCRNFVLDGFPETQRQAKIVFETFGSPLKVFYIDLEKDEVHNRIYAHSHASNPSAVDGLKKEFEHFLNYKDDLFAWLQDKKFFQSVNGLLSKTETFNFCREALSPVIHFCNKNENKELFNQYIRKLEKKGFMYLNLDKIVEAEISRGLPFSKELKNNKTPETFYALIRKIIYAEPLQNQKFIISNFPNDLDFLKRFPEEVCDFGLMLHIQKNEGGVPESQLENFSEEWMKVIGNYHCLNRLVGIGSSDPGIVDFHSEKRNKYGLIVGPTGIGKSAIAKALDKAGILKVIYFKKFNEECIKRFTKDDVAPDDVPISQVFSELNKDLSLAPVDQYTLLDGFNLSDANLDTLIKFCGDPLFVLRLEADKELITKRYMAKNGISGDLSEEDQENINKYFNAFNETANRVGDLAKENTNLAIYDIDVSIPLVNTLDAVKSIFRKRIFLTRITSSRFNQEELRHTMAWLCAKFDYLFIDMESVIEEAKKSTSYSHQDPQTILNIVKFRINSAKRLQRNVMLFNYLQADKSSGKEDHFYPSSKDEIYFLEQHVGKIRACFNFVDTPDDRFMKRLINFKEEKPVVGQLY